MSKDRPCRKRCHPAASSPLRPSKSKRVLSVVLNRIEISSRSSPILLGPRAAEEAIFRTPSVDKFFVTVAHSPNLHPNAAAAISKSNSFYPAATSPRIPSRVRRRISLENEEENIESATKGERRVALIGRNALKCSTKRVQLFKARVVSNDIYREKVAFGDKDPLPFVYHAFFETYTSCSDNEGLPKEDRADLWLVIVAFLRDSMSSRHYPRLETLKDLVHRGILNHYDQSVRHTCAEFMSRLAFLHPPDNPIIRDMYMKALLTKRNGFNEEEEPDDSNSWDVFWQLAEHVAGLNQKGFEHKGAVLLMTLVVAFIKKDLDIWHQRCLKEGSLVCSSRKDWPMLGRLLWLRDWGAVNYRVRSLVNLYCSSIQQSRRGGKIAGITRQLVCLVSELIGICETGKETNTAKECLAFHIATELQKIPKGFMPLSKLWTELFLISPDWLSTLVSHKLLAKMQNLDVMSLRCVVNGLVPPDRLIEIKTSSQETPVKEMDVLSSQSSQECSSQEDTTNSPRKMRKSAKINVMARNKYGETPLHVACRSGNLSRVSDILASPNASINARDNNGWTALHEACSHGRTDCVKLLLAHRPRTIDNYFTPSSKHKSNNNEVDIWAQGGEELLTPLHDAIRFGYLDIVSLLLDHLESTSVIHRALKDVRSKGGHSAIDMVETDEMSELLQRHLANPLICFGSQIADQVFHVESPSRYYVVAASFIYKYVATFRLHATKEAMKKATNLMDFANKKRIVLKFEPKHCQKLMILQSKLTEFPLHRTELIVAQDIRTFWNVTKNVFANPALEMAKAVLQ